MAGFYGKLPSHGDFLQRGLRDEFVNQWDAWLQAGIAQSRRDLGEAWLDIFLTSPVWRFVLASNVIGGAAWAGILLPSVDRVGRYFPLTIATELPPGIQPFDLSVAAQDWFDAIEAAARRVLEEDLVDLDRLEAQLQASDRLLDPAWQRAAAAPLDAPAAGGPVQAWPLEADGDLGRFYAQLAHGLMPTNRSLVLWWSTGSERVAPSVRMSAALSPADLFRSMLCDEVNPAWAAETIVQPRTDVATWKPWRSAALTDIGRLRHENQDAFIERPDDGLWAVADGMGGHRGGGHASRVVGEHLQAVVVGGDLDGAAHSIAAALRAANTELRQRAAELTDFDGGSTVVAFCARDGAGVALWAGDSRLYRLRSGELQQLTRDHSVAEQTDADSDSHSETIAAPGSIRGSDITRAVGGEDSLPLEEIQFGVAPGDRFLLCSDGLYGGVTPAEIAQRLAASDCSAAAASLIALALERGGHDNATAVVVEAMAAEGGGASG